MPLPIHGLMNRILPDIAEVLHAGDDSRESIDEFKERHCHVGSLSQVRESSLGIPVREFVTNCGRKSLMNAPEGSGLTDLVSANTRKDSRTGNITRRHTRTSNY